MLSDNDLTELVSAFSDSELLLYFFDSFALGSCKKLKSEKILNHFHFVSFPSLC